MIDIRKLKELVRLMVANELTELDLRDSEEQVTLRRQSLTVAPAPVQAPAPAVAAAPAAAPTSDPGAGGGTAAPAAVDDGLHVIESPMVGTFYSAANPDSGPFVTAGSKVDPAATVCIIEAMKIFNEIKAECAGTIAEVLVQNGASVEFGQPLFKVKPA